MATRIASALDRLRGTRTMIDRACDHLAASNEQVLAWQCAVTRVPAPTGHESARGAWMAARFTEMGGFAVLTDAIGNVTARRSGIAGDAGGAVWCCAHLDTVFDDPAPAVTRNGSRLEGPGIGDNGRGLAALLALADALHAADMQPP
ncbi:MAG TPA: M28 family peptidase, partial [Gemmatimonadaceae bacterium]|nr:M28 family peptidase [Gemmatimonadaceae bacterium]